MKSNNTCATHSHNIAIFTYDIFFSEYVIGQVFLLYNPLCAGMVKYVQSMLPIINIHDI